MRRGEFLPCGTEHYKDSLTQFEGLRVLPVFWYSAFSGENPPRPMKLNDVSVVPCERCRVFDSVTGRALMFFFFFFFLIIASRSDPSIFFLARFHLGLHKDTFTRTRLLEETFNFWKRKNDVCAPSFLDQVHANLA